MPIKKIPTNKKVPFRKKITQIAIKLSMYKPRKDYFFEKIDPWTMKIHIEFSDANCLSPLAGRFEVIDLTNFRRGDTRATYLVRHKLSTVRYT
jgi:hypothetical protein